MTLPPIKIGDLRRYNTGEVYVVTGKKRVHPSMHDTIMVFILRDAVGSRAGVNWVKNSELLVEGYEELEIFDWDDPRVL